MSDESYPKNFPPEMKAPPPSTLSPSPLPKNFTPEMASAPLPAPPPQPEVTRTEIAEFFAARIVAQRDAARGSSTRPRLYTLTFPYPDFERDVAIAFAAQVGADLVTGPQPELAPPSRPVVTFGAGSGQMLLERFTHTMNHGFDVYVWCPRPWMLDRAVQDLVDVPLAVPRFDQEAFLAACVDFYELDRAPLVVPADLDWIGNVIPRDFLINSQAVGDEIVPSLKRTVERRMARYQAEDWRVIDDLSGMDEARQWATGVVHEIAQARAGRVPWRDVESRVILAGRRGIGKASLARAIARSTGLRFVGTSVGRWQPTPEGGIGAAVTQMHADFEEALAAAPAILYVDDLDLFAIPPFGMLVGPFLEYLRETGPETRTILLAGVQDTDNLSHVLTGRGGLEATVSLSVPNSHALAQMYRVLLRDVTHTLTDSDFAAIGRLSLGLVGQEVDLMVRRARRRASKADQRPVTAQDLNAVLLDEQVGSQAEGRRRLLAPEEMENTAYHEAGHAVMELMRARGSGVLYATIVPRSNGSLGFVVPGIDETRPSMTYQDGIERLRVMLAGRAAEEVYGGPGKITNGCESDLNSAAEHLRYLLTRSGFNGLLSYNQRFERSPELRAKAEEILHQEYNHVVGVLRTHRLLLDRVARLLLDRQELSGDELARIYQAYRAEMA